MFFLLPLLVLSAPPEPASLFDGKTLAGWEGKEEIFRVEEGAIVAGSLKVKIKQNEFLTTTKAYSDFDLTLEAKLVGKGTNAGVQFRSARIPDHHEMIGYQCDIGTTRSDNIWGALYDESRRRKFLALGPQEPLSKAVKQGDWNNLRVRAVGKHIQIWVNGVQTVDYTEEDMDIPQSGLIGLQIHSGAPAEASYRNIKIIELTK
jgi:hypothetical protein